MSLSHVCTKKGRKFGLKLVSSECTRKCQENSLIELTDLFTRIYMFAGSPAFSAATSSMLMSLDIFFFTELMVAVDCFSFPIQLCKIADLFITSTAVWRKGDVRCSLARKSQHE